MREVFFSLTSYKSILWDNTSTDNYKLLPTNTDLMSVKNRFGRLSFAELYFKLLKTVLNSFTHTKPSISSRFEKSRNCIRNCQLIRFRPRSIARGTSSHNWILITSPDVQKSWFLFKRLCDLDDWSRHIPVCGWSDYISSKIFPPPLYLFTQMLLFINFGGFPKTGQDGLIALRS